MATKKTDGSKATKPVNHELPKDFEAEAKKRFDNLECDFKKNEDFIQILDRAKSERLRMQEIEANPSKKYKPALGSMTPCGNGDFESKLDANEWQGASGPITSMTGSFPFASFTAGLSSGSNHQPKCASNVGRTRN